jgi:hypothetical protein
MVEEKGDMDEWRACGSATGAFDHLPFFIGSSHARMPQGCRAA